MRKPGNQLRAFGLSAVLLVGLVPVTGTSEPPAGDDIYSYTDEQGTLHFSNVPTDPRYELYLAYRDVRTRAGEPLNPVLIARAGHYDPIIDRIAGELELQGDLLRAVIAVESGFDPMAESPRGAQGLMQLMPVIASHYGAEDPWNPQQNILAGGRFLKDLMDRYESDLELVLAAYNAGEPAVEAHGRTIPPFAETQDYVPRVLRIYKGLTSLSTSPGSA